MRRTLSLLLAGSCLVFGAAVPVVAHHAFSAEFDAKRPVLLKGKITKVELVSPHTWIHIDVPKADRKGMEEWMVEAGTPNVLLRRGVTKTSIAVGTPVVVTGFQAKDGTNKANGREITFPDGRKLFVGSTGTGAPGDSDPPKPPRER